MRRAYTLTYALIFTLTLIILAGTGNLFSVPQDLLAMTPLILIPGLAFLYFGSKSTYLYFVSHQALSKEECVISAVLFAGVTVVVWVILMVVLSLMGADFL
jgi:hypothetical protein